MQNNLLLVDDEENILRSLVRLLRRDGYNILTANSGAEGLEILEKNAVGVILSDQRMPEMNGVEFLSKVKEIYPDTVRMVLSGYTDLNSVTDAINRGAIYKFLTKPWEDELLRENIKQAFRQFRLYEENQRLADELKAANEMLKGDNESLECNIKEKSESLEFNLAALRLTQDILECLPIAVLGMDLNNLIVLANSEAHAILEVEKGQLLGGALQSSLPEELLEIIELCGEYDSAKEYRLNSGGDKNSVKIYCSKILREGECCGKIIVMQKVDA